MTRIAALALALSIVTACSREDARPAPAPRDVAVRPVLTAATQADLAREIEQADRRGTWREVRQRWEGQRLRWTVTRQKALCRSSEACHVAAFPIQRPAQVGWLPALELSDAEMAKIDRGCGEREQCELVVEGTLTELALSGELPTSVRFSDVQVIRAGHG
jgi:hypothetical protein